MSTLDRVVAEGTERLGSELGRLLLLPGHRDPGINKH
jgi:hypothetical protein